jgi:hypothetical protein
LVHLAEGPVHWNDRSGFADQRNRRLEVGGKTAANPIGREKARNVRK